MLDFKISEIPYQNEISPKNGFWIFWKRFQKADPNNEHPGLTSFIAGWITFLGIAASCFNCDKWQTLWLSDFLLKARQHWRRKNAKRVPSYQKLCLSCSQSFVARWTRDGRIGVRKEKVKKATEASAQEVKAAHEQLSKLKEEDSLVA